MFKGIEANIRPDGTVDMEPHELRQFEFVVASPHSLLRKSVDQTARMVGAVSQPGVSHPGSSAGAAVQRAARRDGGLGPVFAVAARRQVAIEIDGSWDRQDVHYELAARALEHGLHLRARQRRARASGARFHRHRDRARAARRHPAGPHRQLLDREAVPRVGAGGMGSLTTPSSQPASSQLGSWALWELGVIANRVFSDGSRCGRPGCGRGAARPCAAPWRARGRRARCARRAPRTSARSARSAPRISRARLLCCMSRRSRPTFSTSSVSSVASSGSIRSPDPFALERQVERPRAEKPDEEGQHRVGAPAGAVRWR